MARRSMKQLVNDWKATLKEFTEADGIRSKFGSFSQSSIDIKKGFTKAVAKVGKGAFQLVTSSYASSSAQQKRAKDLDNSFFEKVTTLDWKKQSLGHHSDEVKNFATAGEETDEFEGDDKEVTHAASSGQEKHEKIAEEKRKELYSELVYVTLNQFLAEQQKKEAPFPGELYVYGQEVFGISQEQHRELFAKAKGKMILRYSHAFLVYSFRFSPRLAIWKSQADVVSRYTKGSVVGARNIEAKDANGYSDPYCMMGIVTDNSFERKLKRKASKTLTVSEQLEEDVIKITSVKKKTLNPHWNETFSLKVNDIMTETLHLDMWDEDEDSAFLDKDNKITKIRGIAGVGRFLKQVVQSSRKCSSGSTSLDDFLGYVEIPVKDIPSSGIDEWFPLQGRSARSKTHGDCHLTIRLIGKTDNDSANPAESSSSKYDTFATLLKSFLVFDGGHPEELEDVDTSGQLSKFAQWILHQYVIQNNISLLQRAVVEWEVYSNYHQTQPLKYSFLEDLLSDIAFKWKTGGLSLAEEEKFRKSLESFVQYCLQLIKDHRTLYPATDSSKLSRLTNMLTCLRSTGEMSVYSENQSISVSEEIAATVKVAAEKWYAVQYAWYEPKEPTQASAILSLVSFSELIVVDLLKAIKFYSKIFKEVDVDYFSLTYRELEQLLASDMRGSIAKMDPQTLHDEVGDDDLGTKLFSLYLAAKEIVEFKQYLPISETWEFAFDSNHLWFKKFIDQWLQVARKKAEVRISKAVEIDQAMVIDSRVKYSTSAVDVTCCFYQICQFWRRLRWPDPTGSYIFVTKITDDISEAARFYASALDKKLKKNNYYDDNPVYFGVSESWLNELEVHLDWDGVISGMKSAHNEKEAKKCEESLRQICESAQDDLLSKIDDMIYHIGEKMTVDIKKFVFGLVQDYDQEDISNAMDPFLSYLEKSLRTFHSTLLRPVFDRTLFHLWELVGDNFASTVEGQKGKPDSFYRRLSKALEILVDFFCVDGVGIPLDRMMTRKVKSLLDNLLLCQLSTEELIEEYYAEKIKEAAEVSTDLGQLALRMFYDLKNQNLHVELLNGRNLPPMDSNGYCDPYVKLVVSPRHMFSRIPVQRTDIQRKTRFPLFDAKFQFSIPAQSCKRAGAHLQFTVFDYDVLTDDTIGQVFATLNFLPGLNEEIPATFAGIEQLLLPIFHPKPDGQYFQILTERSDELAVKFVKGRQDLHNKLLMTREKVNKRT